MRGLSHKSCIPCEGKVPPLDDAGISRLKNEIAPEWELVGKKLVREFRFPSFKDALHFVNIVGEIAEKEGHHPDIFLSWGKVILTIWTHKIDALTESDFILAAKYDQATVQEIVKKSLL